jgi:hypothetical protein
MQAKWGKTALPVNGAEITSTMNVVEATDWVAPQRYLVAYNVVVYLVVDGQADLYAQDLSIRAALMKRNQDFVLYTDAGKASSAAILAAATASGTRVVAISTPEAQGAEFVTRRTIAFTVTGEYHVADAARAVVSWRETLTVSGNGGPSRRWRFPVNAPAIRQVVTPNSLVRASQRGQAVGYLARPAKPAPLFPAYLVNESDSGTIDTPQYMGNSTYVNWPVSWSYEFERGDGPLVGVPGLPPGVI